MYKLYKVKKTLVNISVYNSYATLLQDIKRHLKHPHCSSLHGGYIEFIGKQQEKEFQTSCGSTKQ